MADERMAWIVCRKCGMTLRPRKRGESGIGTCRDCQRELLASTGGVL